MPQFLLANGPLGGAAAAAAAMQQLLIQVGTVRYCFPIETSALKVTIWKKLCALSIVLSPNFSSGFFVKSYEFVYEKISFVNQTNRILSLYTREPFVTDTCQSAT